VPTVEYAMRVPSLEVQKRISWRSVPSEAVLLIGDSVPKGVRWQYIHSGAGHPHFGKVLTGLITKEQGERMQAALAMLR
jgi:hypothetical protein